MAEAKAVSSVQTELPEDRSVAVNVNGVDLPPEREAVTMIPYWNSQRVHTGIGQSQEMYGVTAVPVCREHVAAQSALAG